MKKIGDDEYRYAFDYIDNDVEKTSSYHNKSEINKLIDQYTKEDKYFIVRESVNGFTFSILKYINGKLYNKDGKYKTIKTI